MEPTKLKKHWLLCVFSVCGNANLNKAHVFIGFSGLWSPTKTKTNDLYQLLVFVEVNMLKKHVCLILFSRLWSPQMNNYFFIGFWQPEPARTRCQRFRAPGGARTNSHAYNNLGKDLIKLKLS